jgi:transformation/transcription domain-associated protein
MPGVAQQLLSEDSQPLPPAQVLPALQSLKVLTEIGLMMALLSQMNRSGPAVAIQSTIRPAFSFLALEAPAQHTARENVEAMGGIWAGMAPSIVNTQAYTDFINAQIKVCLSTLRPGCIFNFNRFCPTLPLFCGSRQNQMTQMGKP